MRFLSIFILLLSSFSFAICDENKNIVVPPEFARVDDLKIRDIVQIMVEHNNIRLNFENIPISLDKPITVLDIIKRENDKKPLTKREMRVLAIAKRINANGDKNSVRLDYVEPMFNVNKIAPLDSAGLLLQITTNISDFSFFKSNGSYVLYWNKSRHTNISDFNLKNATPKEAYATLVKVVLNQARLEIVADNSLPYWNDDDKKITLNLHDVDLYTLLTRFAEALGSDVVWHIDGFTSSRTISFKQTKKMLNDK